VQDCDRGSITQVDLCNNEFEHLRSSIAKLEKKIDWLVNLTIGQFSAIGLALCYYVINQIK
jgi:hypothetical protein